MQIIPAINCENFECVKEKLQKIKEFGAEWIHIDIADGIFTPHKTWNNPKNLSNIKSELSDVNLEIHLMVENPEEAIDGWIKIGVKRIIVHLEAIQNSATEKSDNDDMDVFNFILEKCAAKNIEFGLSINPDTSVETLISYLDKIDIIQILAVNPGLSGQKFQAPVLEKIKFLKELKENYLDTIIEVDGGINLETAKICQAAGVDILVVASFIFNNQNPKIIFEKLKTI